MPGMRLMTLKPSRSKKRARMLTPALPSTPFDNIPLAPLARSQPSAHDDVAWTVDVHTKHTRFVTTSSPPSYHSPPPPVSSPHSPVESLSSHLSYNNDASRRLDAMERLLNLVGHDVKILQAPAPPWHLSDELRWRAIHLIMYEGQCCSNMLAPKPSTDRFPRLKMSSL